MKIDKNYKIEKAVCADMTRAPICQVGITATHAIATDGITLVMIPIALGPHPENPQTVSIDVLAAARKATHKNECHIAIDKLERDSTLRDEDGQWALSNGVVMPNISNGPFPFYGIKQIIDNLDCGEHHTTQVALDVSKLLKICAALGTETVVLRIRLDEKEKTTFSPIIVADDKNERGRWLQDPMGIIMPRKIVK
jgi:hypothetical protein